MSRGTSDGAGGVSQARTMTALLTPLFAALMSISIVNMALPAIEEGLDAGSADLQWVLSGYALAFGVALVPAGRAGDLWGRRRYFLVGVVLFGASSLLCALAPTAAVLNVGRLLMGLGAGTLTPQIIGMIQSLFDGAARGRAYGLMGTVIGAAVAFGPTVGGLLIDLAGDDLGWRLTFLINIPVTAVACVLVVMWLPGPASPPTSPTSPTSPNGPDADPQAGEESVEHGQDPALRSARPGIGALDPMGAVLLSAAVLLLMLPFLGTPGVVGAALGLAGAALLGIWIVWERRLGARPGGSPMVDLRLFSLPSYTLNSVVLTLYFSGMPAIWAIVAVYVQQGLGFSAVVAGLATLPSAVLVMALSSAVGRRVGRFGPRFLVVGTTTAVVAMLLVAGTGALSGTVWGSVWVIAAVVALVGASQAMIIPSAQTLSMQDVPPRLAGAAGGVAQTAQRLATAVGIAVVTAVYFAVEQASDHSAGFMAASLTIAAFLVPSAAMAVLIARRADRGPGSAAQNAD